MVRLQMEASPRFGIWSKEKLKTSYSCLQKQDKFSASRWVKLFESMFLRQKSFIISLFSKIFHLLKRRLVRHKYIVMVHDYQIILNKLRWLKNQLVRILANTTIIDKHTCEICIFSWQLVQTLHGLKIWKRYFRRKTVLIRATLKWNEICWKQSALYKWFKHTEKKQMSAFRGDQGKTTGQITELKNLTECIVK